MPNAWHSPKYKAGYWDGYLKLFKADEKLLYLTLLPDLIKKCKDLDIEIEYDQEDSDWEYETNITEKEVKEFIQTLPLKFPLRDYQEQGVIGALVNKRLVGVSATGSGKSLILYVYTRYLLDNILKDDEKILLIVPTISLVSQMTSDFMEYNGGDSKCVIEREIHQITGGKDKDSNKQIYISTWQSIFNLEESYFSKFKALIVDEVHRSTAQSITKISEQCENAEYRLGVTGTIQKAKTAQIVIKGLLGKIYNIAKTRELQDKGILSNIKIYGFVLRYPETIRKNANIVLNNDYLESLEKATSEKDFCLSYYNRQNFISKIAVKLKGNSLVIFNNIKHGKTLYGMIKKKTDNKVYYIDGKTKGTIREKIRKLVDSETNSIIIASYGVFSTGVNVPSIENIVLASPTATPIRLLQTIGRGLRKSKGKVKLKLVDIIDDLRYREKGSKDKVNNYLYKNYLTRKSEYKKEQFTDIVIKKFELK